MVISREEVEHLAALSRISLSPEEAGHYQEQLSAVLDYVSQLQEAKLRKNSLPQTSAPLQNVWREDKVRDWPEAERAAALSQGETEAGQIKVLRVL